MNFFQYQGKNQSENIINQNLFVKKSSIPKPQNVKKNSYNNRIINYNRNIQNLLKRTTLFPNDNTPKIPTYNLNSFGNIKQDNFQDIDMLKIKMSFDLINQKIDNMENIIRSLNEDNKNLDVENNQTNKMYLRDKIRTKKEVLKYRQNKINKIKSKENSRSKENIFSTLHNYSVQNIKDQRYYNNFINNSRIDKNDFNNNYNSIQNEKSTTFINPKSNHYRSINKLNLINDKIYSENDDTIEFNYNKASNSLNNYHIQNQKKIIPNRLVLNNSFFNNLNKIPNVKNYKNHKKNNSYRKQSYNLKNALSNVKFSDDNNYNTINNKNIESIGKYFGSFDDYFLSDEPKIPQGKANNNKNNKIKRLNVINKRRKNHEAKLNIYNIVKNDKIIQNNYYQTKNKSQSINNSNLTIVNQKSISFFINNKKESNKKYINNSDKKKINQEITRNKFTLDQLQKCSATDLFLPNKIQNPLKNDIIIENNIYNNNIIKAEQFNIKKDVINNICLNIIDNNNIKPILGKSKDDFYYDLYAEKIIEIKKINNSYDEIHLLPRLHSKYLDKSEKKNTLKSNKKPKQNNYKKKVKFLEGDNRIIEINQKDLASKFKVFNNNGKRIYYKKFNINNYMNKLKNKNLKLKSIYINKKEELTDNDNSEWDKLYDIINKIAKKGENEKNKDKIRVDSGNKYKKGKFNIKNIESFKKGKKNIDKNNKNKK